MIKVRCAKCGKTLNIPDQFAGKKGKCPGCQEMLTIPAASAEVSAVAPAPPRVRKPAPPAPVEEVEEVEEAQEVEAEAAEEVEAEEEERIADRPANSDVRPAEVEDDDDDAGLPASTMRTLQRAENPGANGPNVRTAAPPTPPASAGPFGAASSAR